MAGKRLDALVDLCESEQCRRQNLLGYFGEAAQPCGNCDICLAPPRWWRALSRFGRSRRAGISGLRLTFESRMGFPADPTYASLAHANRNFHQS
jgi:hypothetical protein